MLVQPSKQQALRGILCAFVLTLPILAAYAAAFITAPRNPGQDVNMFGVAAAQWSATITTFLVAVALFPFIVWLLRLGWLWLGYAVGIAVVVFVLYGVMRALLGTDSNTPGWVLFAVLAGSGFLGGFLTRGRLPTS